MSFIPPFLDERSGVQICSSANLRPSSCFNPAPGPGWVNLMREIQDLADLALG